MAVKRIARCEHGGLACANEAKGVCDLCALTLCVGHFDSHEKECSMELARKVLERFDEMEEIGEGILTSAIGIGYVSVLPNVSVQLSVLRNI